jgi:polyphosphate kinase
MSDTTTSQRTEQQAPEQEAPEQQASEEQAREPQAPERQAAAPALDSSELYFNRELSWLEFDYRVLQLAEDENMPLLERVKFLSIFCSNLDEFFMVRVAGHHDQVDAGIEGRGPDGLTAQETIDRIAERVHELDARMSDQWEHVVRPKLEQHGVRLVNCESCNDAELRAADRVFHDQIFPTLTPLAVGPVRPFPYISNLSLSIAVWVRDPVTGNETFARVKVPKEVLPRFIEIGEGTFIPLESIIARNLHTLFPGMEIVTHDFFRVTRDADFTVSDEADDLLRAVEYELRRRRFGEVVRLELGSGMDERLRSRLIGWLAVEERQIYDVDGMLDLSELMELYEIDGHKDLRDPPWTPVTQPAFAAEEGEQADVFEEMRRADLLVHQPYDSFSSSVERLLQQAVQDPDVLAIKLTVYRTSEDSDLVPALIEAAERGKQVVCLVELKARFDERRNIGWARVLEEAGAHVVHGLPGLKTHAKSLIVIRREGEGVGHYAHIGTGNYNAKTARIYEDFGLFTTDEDVTADVADLFNTLTGFARPQGYRKVVTAPTHMRDALIEEIEATVAAHEDGDDARIAMKMNSLVDQRCIEALYRASQAGVRVDLNTRGICCLRPGVKGVSENIRVVSVVGQFLEHSRIYSFHRGDEHHYWIGSADLMPRNLDNRVELLAPVESEPLKAEMEDTLERCFADDTFAWELQEDGSWIRRDGGERSVHAELRERALARATTEISERPPESPAAPVTGG